MASGVGSLDSLDLLDLLFDRQDGILRGVELGTPPGTWHKDGVSPLGWGGAHPHLIPGSGRRAPSPRLARELGLPCTMGSSCGHPRVTGTPG